MFQINIFLSTLSLRRATSRHTSSSHSDTNFYPRSPCGERLHGSGIQPRQEPISIHALLAESDVFCFRFSVFDFLFLSTLSLRRATANAVDQILPGHISIHALLAESDTNHEQGASNQPISIHALLAESDSAPSITPTASRNFYPRSPCGERRVVTAFPGSADNFYPRSPCGERQYAYKGV